VSRTYPSACESESKVVHRRSVQDSAVSLGPCFEVIPPMVSDKHSSNGRSKESSHTTLDTSSYCVIRKTGCCGCLRGLALTQRRAT
jgi:hypothetical protein